MLLGSKCWSLKKHVLATFCHDEEHGCCEEEERDVRECPVAEKAGVPVKDSV